MTSSHFRLSAISPLDGRYQEKVSELSPFVSEFALVKARIGVEIKYLFALSKIKVVNLSSAEKKKLLNVVADFDLNGAEKIKKIEETTKHDVKAVEIYLRLHLSPKNAEMVHFGLTSEDVNNLAQRIILRSGSNEIIIPTLEKLSNELFLNSQELKNSSIIARTHGQPAVPTTLGKEFAVFASRLSSELKKLRNVQFTGKLNGAVGNYNALAFAYPKIDWIKFSENFVESLGFEPNLVTTQLNSNEDIIEYFQVLQRINGVILDLNQDLWRYISDDWLALRSEREQVGSSTMPQKINPIDFENSEGNLKLANGLIEVFCRELPISRLQRDLSNSTIIRNIGVVLAHSLLAYKGNLSGLSKISVDREQISENLNKDWSILSEALQTILRLEGVKDSYSKTIELMKGKHFAEKEWKELIGNLEISRENKEKLTTLTPSNYTGLAKRLASK